MLWKTNDRFKEFAQVFKELGRTWACLKIIDDDLNINADVNGENNNNQILENFKTAV